MTPLVVRDASPADREVIRRLTLAAYGEYAARMPTLWERYRENILATLTDVEGVEQIVAERDGEVLAAVLLYPAGHQSGGNPAASGVAWPYVRLLAVLPAARGRGVGRALMDECARRARESGAPVLALHTIDLMEAAQRMYARMGFVRAAELDFRPASGITVTGYRLDLRGP